MRKALLAIALLSSILFYGQDIRVNANVDTSEIRIGEQFDLHLSIEYRIDNGDVEISWPLFPDSLLELVEVIRTDSVNKRLTNPNDQFRFTQEQTLRLTSFEPGTHTIPAFNFVVNKEFYLTDPITIAVNTVEVDTTLPIKPIKEIYAIDADVTADEGETEAGGFLAWLQDNWLWLLIIVAILIGAYVGIRKARKMVVEEPVDPEPIYSADEIALKQLAELKDKQLWQAGRIKDFHIELTDILRTYVEARFNIPAHEQTTDEIVSAMRFAMVDERMKMILNQVLRLSDMVKFAKEKPIGMENEQSYDNAKRFVEETRFRMEDSKFKQA